MHILLRKSVKGPYRFIKPVFVKHILFLLINFGSLLFQSTSLAQNKTDSSIKKQDWNFHFQTTLITQYHPAFQANYSGINSLNPNHENATSITATAFFGIRLWKNAELYIDPELSGGNGFSKTTGVAGFTNGEVYRVSDPSPKIYLARLYVKQVFPLQDHGKSTVQDAAYSNNDANQLATLYPRSYIAVSAGRFSIMDHFDDNTYSHDPRSQFYNWALMGNAAWDYPANTRGYTNGFTLELVKPRWSLRLGSVMVPTEANGAIMDTKIFLSNSEALEYEQQYSLGNQQGKIRLIGFFTSARMGNYREAIQWGKLHDTVPNLILQRAYGRTKYGAGINVEHHFTEALGAFFRASWNDGHNETWAFTEIDRHVSMGLSLDGKNWKRNGDIMGIAVVINGLSKDHRDFLAAGGSGFIIGDGKLNYGSEFIAECYYSCCIKKLKLWVSPDYQFIINPAYNKDRGPVHVAGLRMHFAL